MVHQVETEFGDTFWVQTAAESACDAGATMTLSTTAPTEDRTNFVIVEIVPQARLRRGVRRAMQPLASRSATTTQSHSPFWSEGTDRRCPLIVATCTPGRRQTRPSSTTCQP